MKPFRHASWLVEERLPSCCSTEDCTRRLVNATKRNWSFHPSITLLFSVFTLKDFLPRYCLWLLVLHMASVQNSSPDENHAKLLFSFSSYLSGIAVVGHQAMKSEGSSLNRVHADGPLCRCHRRKGWLPDAVGNPHSPLQCSVMLVKHGLTQYKRSLFLVL